MISPSLFQRATRVLFLSTVFLERVGTGYQINDRAEHVNRTSSFTPWATRGYRAARHPLPARQFHYRECASQLSALSWLDNLPNCSGGERLFPPVSVKAMSGTLNRFSIRSAINSPHRLISHMTSAAARLLTVAPDVEL